MAAGREPWCSWALVALQHCPGHCKKLFEWILVWAGRVGYAGLGGGHPSAAITIWRSQFVNLVWNLSKNTFNGLWREIWYRKGDTWDGGLACFFALLLVCANKVRQSLHGCLCRAEGQTEMKPCLGRAHSEADKPVLGSPHSQRDSSSGVPVALLASPVGLCLCWPISDGPTLPYSRIHRFVQVLALVKAPASWVCTPCTEP